MFCEVNTCNEACFFPSGLSGKMNYHATPILRKIVWWSTKYREWSCTYSVRYFKHLLFASYSARCLDWSTRVKSLPSWNLQMGRNKTLSFNNHWATRKSGKSHRYSEKDNRLQEEERLLSVVGDGEGEDFAKVVFRPGPIKISKYGLYWCRRNGSHQAHQAKGWKEGPHQALLEVPPTCQAQCAECNLIYILNLYL